MTAAFLQSELTSLILDSKRKHPDIKTASERSLTELRSISVTSETQLAGDLIRKVQFIDPFILACKSQHVKLASTGAACLQRLVAAVAIPRARLPDVLQAFEGAVSLALEVQLKILQTLPSLLQLYAADLHGEALARTLNVSADLSASKLPMVSSTAGATFQQLVTAVFVQLSGGAGLQSSACSSRDRDDAYAIFIDICGLLTQDAPRFVRLANLPPSSVLETLESLLSAYGTIILDNEAAQTAIEGNLLPGLCKLIEDSSNYGVVVRAIRISFVLATGHIATLGPILEKTITTLLRLVDRSSSHHWKRILGLEFFRGICTDFEALRLIFIAFDLQEDRQNVVSNLLSSLVRISSEDPSLIGLGRQSTLPASGAAETNKYNSASVDVPMAHAVHVNGTPTGISTEWSSIPTSCLDVVDRPNAVQIPETYIFVLVIGFISAFSDGLSKVIMPLSMPSRKASSIEEVVASEEEGNNLQRRPSPRGQPASQRYQQLVNPLTKKGIARRDVAEHCANMIESCWPAVLAICSTFLNAALDSHYYHMLIRTVQKLTQVSGVLELNTPRDAFLTTLAKVSVPPNVSSIMNTYYGSKPALTAQMDSDLHDDSHSITSPIAGTPRQSSDLSLPILNLRNLLCSRALLNLGIALGPTLHQSAWMIILQSLEQVEALMSIGPSVQSSHSSTNSGSAPDGPLTTLASELSAVDTARRRLFESTTTYSESAFKIVCESLLQMIEDILPRQDVEHEQEPRSNDNFRSMTSAHRPTRSVSWLRAKTLTLEIEVQFVLLSLGRLSFVNLYRFRAQRFSPVAWDLIIGSLLRLQSNDKLLTGLRLQCANIIDALVVETCTGVISEDERENNGGNDVQASIAGQYGIPALNKQLDNIRSDILRNTKDDRVSVQTVQALLQALQNVIGHCGDRLDSGWTGVFKICKIVMFITQDQMDDTARASLLASNFKVVQLIVSDFMSTLDETAIMPLIELFDGFARQQIDLNISLTTSALYWSIASLLITRADHLEPFPMIDDAPLDLLAITTLWHRMVTGLANLCKDRRSEIRDASLSMMVKVLNASIALMSPETLSSSLSSIHLPLLNFYAEQCATSDKSWHASASKLIQAFEQLTVTHASTLLASKGFDTVWMKHCQACRMLLKLEDLTIMMTVFDSLSTMIKSLRQTAQCTHFNANLDLATAVWNLWSTYQPSFIEATSPNGGALASHAHLLLEIAQWQNHLLSGTEQASDTILAAVQRSIFSALHDQYTLDVRKISPEQEQILQILKILERVMVKRRAAFVETLLSFANNLVERTNGLPQALKPPPTGTRIPTGIAFSTACIEETRRLLQSVQHDEDLQTKFPVVGSISLSTKLVQTKYSTLPSNEQNPLWQKACYLGAECVAALRRPVREVGYTDELDQHELGQAINNFVKAILDTLHLTITPIDKLPSKAQLEGDESFDMAQLQKVHTACQNASLFSHFNPQERKTYILTLFSSSLVAKPWYNDLSTDLENAPLRNITRIRPYSCRDPVLPIRRAIYREALSCLFDLVSSKHSSNNDGHPSNADVEAIAPVAAPYILLRTAHTLKSFIADQPVRYLNHPHRVLQGDLKTTLTLFTSLRVQDSAFKAPAEDLGCSDALKSDGKSHLRILWNLMVEFERIWNQAPRLAVRPWQADEEGVSVERSLAAWRNALIEGWGPRFG